MITFRCRSVVPSIRSYKYKHVRVSGGGQYATRHETVLFFRIVRANTLGRSRTYNGLTNAPVFTRPLGGRHIRSGKPSQTGRVEYICAFFFALLNSTLADRPALSREIFSLVLCYLATT